jgi:hypothetical protein
LVLGSHQFSRHANQHTHGSRTHRLGRRRLACSTAPLWHRPIYRQWGIPPRPETAIASVARAGFRASMPRVIYGGDQLPQQPRSPPIPKQRAFHAKRETAKETSHRNSHISHSPQSGAPFAQSAKQQPGYVSPSATISALADLKAVNAGNPRAGRGFSPEHSAGRKEAPQREARCGASLHVRGRSGEKPRPAPGFPVGVLDLVGLSTYRRPADQRWQQR